MNFNDLHHKTEQLRALAKYGISGVAFLATLHCGMLCFGYDVVYVHIAFCIFAMTLGIALSRVFDLCIIHKISVVYIVMVLLCIVMRRHDVFSKLGICLHSARAVMFVIGLIVTVCNITKTIRNRKGF